MVPVLAAVLRTDNLAGIAAVEPVPDLGHIVLAQEALGLGQEGDAGLGIELSRSDQRAGRTGIDAFGAVAAALLHRLVWRQREIRHHLPR